MHQEDVFRVGLEFEFYWLHRRYPLWQRRRQGDASDGAYDLSGQDGLESSL